MKSENEIQQLIRIEAAKHKIILWRNNSGVLNDESGRPVRFGLSNESKEQNKRFKSSDLIGISSQGYFVAIEVKEEGWVFNGTEREFAQKNFIDFVKVRGGFAGFADSVDSFKEIVKDLI